MLSIKYSKSFKRDLKLFKNNKSVIFELKKVLDILVSNKQLPKEKQNHRLKGEFSDCFECHLKPNVLLIYKIEKEELLVLLLRIDSHQNLF